MRTIYTLQISWMAMLGMSTTFEYTYILDQAWKEVLWSTQHGEL